MTPSKTVLLVDDSPTVRRMLDWSLRPAGLAILQAGDGLEALEILRDRAADLIIVDLNMPRMDGIEFTRALRGDPRLHAIPVILLTTESRAEDQALAREAGVDLYLTKPASPALLRAKALSLLGLTTVKGNDHD